MDQDIIIAKSLTLASFEAAIRKAAEVYGEKLFIVVGRGSVAVTLPGSSDHLRRTGDIDLFAPYDPAKVDAWAELDRTVSVESPFFIEHGFYIERVGEWTLISQPSGWQERAIHLHVDDIEVFALHPLDLAYNKLEAGRPKDIDFMREGLNCKAYDYVEVLEFIQTHAPDRDTREMILEKLHLAAA
jgi:hypothetical protein